MENTEDKKRTVSEAMDSLNIELDEAVSILERYANLSNLDEKSKISNWAFRVLEGIVQSRRAKERDELMSKLKNLSKESPEFPPHETAMCYCPAPPDWRKPNVDNGQGGTDQENGVIRKALIILAIITVVASVVAIAFVI